ncbi:unnamed protein product [Lupinus luteus]|uniref:Uncharacterized protein n=1 Tax=Lupinus luteus TaxID=3873 RepID=A0AAV1W6H5_LUPLU
MTLPLGSVEHMLKGNSSLGSIDNLYRSLVDLDTHKYLKFPSIKDKLDKTDFTKQFEFQKKQWPIDEVPISFYSCYTEYDDPSHIPSSPPSFYNFGGFCCNSLLQYSYFYSNSPSTYQKCSVKGFVKSSSLYMVTDDLVVTQTSSMSIASFLAMSNISPSDLEERAISIGRNECLNLLKSSLISSSALSDGLRQFINPIKKEKISN